LGEIHEDLVFPWPQPDPAEQDKVRALIAAAHDVGSRLDPRKIEEDGWIGDDVVRELGERGLCGLYVPERYGGQGLSQTGYARVFETLARIDATLSIVLGVHQSIGFKGIHMFGTEEQKERFLPDLAAGRKLAGFALTEPNAGSDAYHIESRAVQQADGSWLLNGEKRYIGNGGRALCSTFARARDSKVATSLMSRSGCGLRSAALRHDGAARERPSPPLLQGVRYRRRPRRARGASASRGISTTADRPGLRLRRRREVAARQAIGTSPSAASSAAAGRPTGPDKIGWMVTYCSGWNRCAI
jgi:alkylation response protein AidB-like acyl-CoA dehydrogenase